MSHLDRAVSGISIRARLLALILMCTASACSERLEGVVIGAGTGKPVPGATVRIWNDRWGFRDGRLVWDKSYPTQSITGPSGHFRLSVGGGINLTVNAAGYPRTLTSACPSPMLIRVGGPYWNDTLGGNASLGRNAAGQQVGWSFAGAGKTVPAGQSDLSLEGSAEEWSRRQINLRAPLGMIFIRGAGNPPAPSPSGFKERLAVDLDACGWLIVKTLHGAVAVHPNAALATGPDGSQLLIFRYRKLAPSHFGETS